jgi:hypothetical protein
LIATVYGQQLDFHAKVTDAHSDQYGI